VPTDDLERRASDALVEKFISTWSDREGGREISNYALFLTQLCTIIGVDQPEPAGASHEFNDYVFERYVERTKPDGSIERGRVDLYKRNSFILEAKQSRLKGGKKAIVDFQGDLFPLASEKRLPVSSDFDALMINARNEAEDYAHFLPLDHKYPPFIIACDVGRALEIFADFSGHGRHYSPFPDSRSYRVELTQLADPEIRERLRLIWKTPEALDPSKKAARVTREIAGQLSNLSKALEERGFEPGIVSLFLMRCLFTMFVEDVELIKKDSFKDILDKCWEQPRRFPSEMEDLWRHMDIGDYSPAIGEKLLRFNGKLFKNAAALPLTSNEVGLLRKAAAANWRDLEPAIFGSLFEQALDKEERKRLGAHYTPRQYVERLVNATIMEPLNQDWAAAQTAAERALSAGSRSIAIREIQDFLTELATVRVLDPAAGTGNFLYVSLRRMKQLEGEALKQLQNIGGAEAVASLGDISVKPEQFFGLEVNRRAIEIAELVLWIGYLQWHLRSRGAPPSPPILGNNDHILERDALLTWDGYPILQPKRDQLGRPTRTWVDAKSADAQSYPNPGRPEWPAVDFIIGNPPFMGGKDIRSRRGDAYAEALWKANKNINPSADYVMFWWDRAAELLTRKNTRLRRFGFVTTNSIDQVFQRRVTERHLRASAPVSIVSAFPHHPWTKAEKEAAAVRITMTVVAAGAQDGTLHYVINERGLGTDEPIINFLEQTGRINSDLTIGADVTGAVELGANAGLCSPGVKLHGDGFIVSRERGLKLGIGSRHGLEQYIRPYRNGRDLTARSRNVLVIDLFGLAAEDVRRNYPEVYQHLLETVKPARQKVYDKSHSRDAKEYLENWWIFGKPRQELRPALVGLNRYIATVETTKHRIFQFLDASIIPDNMLVVIASADAFHLGVLSSRAHVLWTLASGGTLEDRPRYSKSKCFDPFPFPDASEQLRHQIRNLSDELDQIRRRVLSEDSKTTLTGLYNVIQKLRANERLTIEEERLKSNSLARIIKDLHDQIDALVLRAYGWSPELSDDDIIDRLVRLNTARAAEERGGLTRWVRPEYQVDKFGVLMGRADRLHSISAAAGRTTPQPFPTEPKVQAAKILQLLRRSEHPLSVDEIATSFKAGKQHASDVREILSSLNRLGEARSYDQGRTFSATAGG
jgi:hypothetical protein